MRFRAAFPALHPCNAVRSCIPCTASWQCDSMWVSGLHFLPLTQCSTAHSCISCTPSLQRSSQLHFLQPFPCSAWVRAAFSCTPSLQRGCRGWVRSAAPATLSMQCRGRPASPALRPCSAAASQLRSASPAPHPCNVGSDLHLLQCCPCSAGSSLQRGCVAAQLRALLHPILAAWGQICISCNTVRAGADLHLLHPTFAFWGQISISCNAVHAPQLRSASLAPHLCILGARFASLAVLSMQCWVVLVAWVHCSSGLHLLHPIFAFWGQTSISCNAVHAPQLRSASPAPHLCILGSDQHLL